MTSFPCHFIQVDVFLLKRLTSWLLSVCKTVQKQYCVWYESKGHIPTYLSSMGRPWFWFLKKDTNENVNFRDINKIHFIVVLYVLLQVEESRKYINNTTMIARILRKIFRRDMIVQSQVVPLTSVTPQHLSLILVGFTIRRQIHESFLSR